MMDLKRLTLEARNMGQGRAKHKGVMVVVRRTHIGWQATYFVDDVERCAKAAEKALAARG
jgi:hypothetical protein